MCLCVPVLALVPVLVSLFECGPGPVLLLVWVGEGFGRCIGGVGDGEGLGIARTFVTNILSPATERVWSHVTGTLRRWSGHGPLMVRWVDTDVPLPMQPGCTSTQAPPTQPTSNRYARTMSLDLLLLCGFLLWPQEPHLQVPFPKNVHVGVGQYNDGAHAHANPGSGSLRQRFRVPPDPTFASRPQQVLHAIALAAVDRPGWHDTPWYKTRYGSV